jgi:hypothetical protein
MDDEAADLGVSDEERQKRKRILDRRSGADLKKRWEQGDRADLEKREESIAPPRVFEPRCHVCSSDYRDFVEESLVKGHSYERIAKRIPADKDEKKIDRRSISNHFREHMDLQRTAIREELEEEAKALQQNVESGALGAKTDRGILKVLVAKGFDDVIKGVSTVEPKDLIQIIKLLNELNNNASTSRAEETEISLRIFVRAIQDVCDQETIAAIVAKAEKLRQMDDVEFEVRGVMIPEPKMIEAEVVESAIIEGEGIDAD